MTAKVAAVVAPLMALIGAVTSCRGEAYVPDSGQIGYCSSHVERVADLPSQLIEASGVTRDPRSSDLYWVHNDSGNPAELFGVDGGGRLLAVVPVSGASDRDIEDIATGPCGAGSCLFLADIGDNLGVHGSISVHRLPLPRLPDGEPDRALRPSVVSPEATWHLVYPSGPRDAEGLAIDGDRGELLIVTKGREGVVELYSAAMTDLGERPGSPDTLVRVGALRLPIGETTRQLVTAADLSPDGTRLAIRSYTTLYGFDWSGAAGFDTMAVPRHAPLLAALEAQGEGLGWDSAGESLVLVSEGRDGRPPSLSRIPCRDPSQRD